MANIDVHSRTETTPQAMQELAQQSLLTYLRAIRNTRTRKFIPVVNGDGLRVRMKLVDLEGRAASEWSPWLEPGEILQEDKQRLDRVITNCLLQLNGENTTLFCSPIFQD